MSALDALQKNASRLTSRLQETLSESTRAFSNVDLLDTPEDKLQLVKRQLDSRNESDKLEAMKRLIALISKGRNVASFFPDVVKNVGAPNLEIRKLVYIYLIRYAESEPDLALLSVNTFQKDLADPNPLIRAMALRVLSSIRVPMTVGIVTMAIRKAAADSSPYVRKAAALAIPKCYSLDDSQLSALLAILVTLLQDRSPLAIGSIVTAFNALAPQRLDLLHPHFRRLCRMLADADEWGQVVLVDLLGRYARTMFTKPHPADDLDALDPDLRLLLNSCEPLFHSRNAAVIVAAARTFYHVAPLAPALLLKPITPLLRLMHASKEIECVVVHDLGVIAREWPALLHSHVPRFFLRADDSAGTALEKMRILGALTTVDNAATMLREFAEYTHSSDGEIVAASVRAIGRCAARVPEVAQQCVAVLMGFIEDPFERLVTAVILVLKSLIQSQASSDPVQAAAIIARLAARVTNITHPAARAAVVWLVGQYSTLSTASSADDAKGVLGLEAVLPCAPDVLRRIALGFAGESVPTKLQALTLAAKLLVLAPNHQTIRGMASYVFELARYDVDWDVRDRGRMLAALVAALLPTTSSEPVDDAAWRAGAEVHLGAQDDVGKVVLRAEQIKLVLFGNKVTAAPEPLWLHEHTVMGSLALLTGRDMQRADLVPVDRDRGFPEWPDEGTDGALRDSAEDKERPVTPLNLSSLGSGPATSSGPIMTGFGSGNLPPSTSSPLPSTGKGQWKDLDSFYGDDDDELEDDSGGSEDNGDDDDDADESVPLAPAMAATRAAPHLGAPRQESEEGDEDDSDEGSDASGSTAEGGG